MPLLWKPCTEELVSAPLQQMDLSSSPGDDGIQAAVFQAFFGFYVRHMTHAYGEIETGGLPPEWITALVGTLAKELGSAAVQSQRPIALQQARLKWLTGILLLELWDALFQIVPHAQKAYLKGRTMYDHIASVQQRWDSGRGDSWAWWIAVDYSKAYDSVSHSIMTNLFRYISIPDPWICVRCQILRGLVPFLVGGDVVKKEQLLPSYGTHQGDPLSPIFSSLLTSLISLYCGAIALRCGCILMMRCCISCSWTAQTQMVQSVLDDFTEFGAFTGLRLNLHKTKALMQGVGPWPVQLLGIQVVSSVNYLGALFGDVSPAEAYEKSVGVFESWCLHISRMPLSAKERVQLVHTWCCPVLQVTAVAFYPP